MQPTQKNSLIIATILTSTLLLTTWSTQAAREPFQFLTEPVNSEQFTQLQKDAQAGDAEAQY